MLGGVGWSEKNISGKTLDCPGLVVLYNPDFAATQYDYSGRGRYFIRPAGTLSEEACRKRTASKTVYENGRTACRSGHSNRTRFWSSSHS